MDNILEIIGRFTSRKFLLVVGIFALVVLNDRIGLHINDFQVGALVTVALGFITAEGYKDIKEVK